MDSAELLKDQFTLNDDNFKIESTFHLHMFGLGPAEDSESERCI